MGGTGKVHFPVTTKIEEAQRFFEQGVGQLHGFWYFEAERTFRQVAALDPECAMAYWGMAMANFENNKRAKGFIKEAVERKASATKREQMYIDGFAAYCGDEPKDRKRRRREYLRSLESIIHEFPDDIEAKAFLCVRLWQFKGSLPIPSYEAVNALLMQILDAEPMHPAHHYRIHLWDGEKPEQGLFSAARCGQASPSIAHMWHMSGHIFSKLKRYADAAWQQEASARVDHAQMIRDRVLPDQIHNYAHNNEWLIRDLSHIGRVYDAVDLAKNMIELPRHPKYNTVKKRGSGRYGRQRLLEVLERYELWKELLAALRGPYLEPTDELRDQLTHLRALGMAGWGLGRRQELRKPISHLKEKLAGEREKRQETRKKAREKARQDKKSVLEMTKAVDKAARSHDRTIADIRDALQQLRGYRDLLVGRKEKARERFEGVKGINESHRARLMLATGDQAKAEELARKVVDKDDKRVAALANYADILFQNGKKEEAKRIFEQLRAISASIDLDAPVFRRLEPIAKELKHPTPDWRIEAVVADDVGDRPDLDSLGPFRWHPSPAPDWELSGPDGKQYSLKQYRGKPVVVIFFLGHGCLHCVEQIETFAPKAEEFRKQGISLIAISSEDHKQLAKAIKAFEKDGKTPGFPLIADPKLEVFKAYRAFDDFEEVPLHGTFLIDSEGQVRCQDISYEPFNDPDFVLKEAARLLGRPEKPASKQL